MLDKIRQIREKLKKDEKDRNRKRRQEEQLRDAPILKRASARINEQSRDKLACFSPHNMAVLQCNITKQHYNRCTKQKAGH